MDSVVVIEAVEEVAVVATEEAVEVAVAVQVVSEAEVEQWLSHIDTKVFSLLKPKRKQLLPSTRTQVCLYRMRKESKQKKEKKKQNIDYGIHLDLKLQLQWYVVLITCRYTQELKCCI